MMDLKGKAELLKKLHKGPEILVLPNAWDAASARALEAAGYPAIATSSSACAAVLGYDDGEQIPRDEMMFLVRKIAGAVDVPVTADLEAGYGDPVGTALAAWEVGAVGMNFEDKLIPLEAHVAHIQAIRAAAPDFVINARTDVYWMEDGDPETRLARTAERLNAYLAAGANCAFAPGVRDAETIAQLVKAVQGPVNILAQPGSPSITEMKALGVARVSFGGGSARVAKAAFNEFLKELKAYGTFSALA